MDKNTDDTTISFYCKQCLQNFDDIQIFGRHSCNCNNDQLKNVSASLGENACLVRQKSVIQYVSSTGEIYSEKSVSDHKFAESGNNSEASTSFRTSCFSQENVEEESAENKRNFKLSTSVRKSSCEEGSTFSSSSDANNQNVANEAAVVDLSERGGSSSSENSPNRGIFKCPACPSLYQLENSLLEDTKWICDKKADFQCLHCGFETKRHKVLNQHIDVLKNHKINKYSSSSSLNKQTEAAQCPETRIESETKKETKTKSDEDESSGNQKIICCPDCNRSFQQESSFKIHQSLVCRGKEPQCPYCTYRAEHESLIKIHIERMHKVRIVRTISAVTIPAVKKSKKQ